MNENNLHRIEHFLDERMDKASSAAFLEELKQDPTLLQQVKLEVLVREGSRLLGKKKVRTRVGQMMTGFELPDVDVGSTPGPAPKPPPPKVFSLRRKWTAVAASLLLLAVPLYLFYGYAPHHYSNDVMVTNHYIDPGEDLANNMMGEIPNSSINDATNRNEAKKAWRAEQYGRTAAYVDAIKDKTAEDHYLKAHALYKLKKFDEAIPVFTKVAQSDTQLKEKGEYYLLLSYLVVGRSKEASFQALLSKVSSDGNHDYNRQARDIQARLRSFLRRFAE